VLLSKIVEILDNDARTEFPEPDRRSKSLAVHRKNPVDGIWCPRGVVPLNNTQPWCNLPR